MPQTSKLHFSYSALLAAATFFLLFAGGMVTSTDSGLAVPDWPLSFGSLNPPMVGGIFYEHGHRVIAATVGFLIIIQALWCRFREPRAWVRRLSYWALFLVVVQGLLGGLTVLMQLPSHVSMLHTLVGNTVFCLVLAVAYAHSPIWDEHPQRIQDNGVPSLQLLGRMTAGVAIVQLALGALVRHAHVGLMVHMTGAFVLFIVFALQWVRILRTDGLSKGCRRLNSAVGFLLVLQVGVGLLVWVDRVSVPLATLHMILGALIVSHLVVLAWFLLRQTLPVRALQTGMGRA